MRFTADQLVVFATVADEGAVGRAARRLAVSQPAVSSRLRTLETLAGRRLYRRTPRGIELTDAGRLLLPHAQAVRRALGRGHDAMAAPDAGERRAAIALSDAAIHRFVPVVMAEAMREPRLDVRVIPTDAVAAVAAVTAGAADLAVVVVPPDAVGDDLVRRPVALEPIRLVVPPGAGPVALGDVPAMRVAWQARGSNVRATAERVLERQGLWPEDTLELGSSPAVLAAVAAGLGVGFLTASFAEPWRVSGQVEVRDAGDPGLEARFELIASTLDELTTASRRIADALRRDSPPPAV